MADSDIYIDPTRHHHGRRHDAERRDAHPEDVDSHAAESAPRDDEHLEHEEESRHQERTTDMSKRTAKTLSTIALTLTSILTITTGAAAYERREGSAGDSRAARQQYRVDFVRGQLAEILREDGDRDRIGDRIEARDVDSVRRPEGRGVIELSSSICAIRDDGDIIAARACEKVDEQYLIDRAVARDRNLRLGRTLDRERTVDRVGDYIERGSVIEWSEITTRERA